MNLVNLQSVLFVGAGAAVGGVFRLLIVTFAATTFPGLPVGTILVNSIGSLAAGLLLPLLPDHAIYMKQIFVTGFLGGLTTMSGFAADTVELFRGATGTEAALYWAAGSIGSVIFCVVGLIMSTYLMSLRT